MDEFRRLDVELQMQQIICQREGMIAENEVRKDRGLAPAYDEEGFQKLITALELLRNVIRG